MSSSNILKLEVIDINIPQSANVIIGRSHFIKSVEDIYEALVTSSTSIKFGLAFNEASGKRLIRYDGNDEELISFAIEAARTIGAGHVFVIYLRNAWPINVLNALKSVQEVVSLYVATSNPVQLIIAETNQGRTILGAVDGFTPLGVESEEDVKERKELLRKIGYKR
ncbi:MAG: adenosine-specific kinase [Fervidicoccaceae archaeon]|nr:MAG: adenosine monophosphate-protein transferase [Fervidicoccus fontis]